MTHLEPQVRRGETPVDATPVDATAAGRSRLILIALGFVLLFACLLVFGTIAQDVHRQEAIALDQILTPLLHDRATPVLDRVMWAITTIGSTSVVAPLFVLTEILLLRARRNQAALFLAVAILGSVLLNTILKLFFQRPRPQLPWAQTPLDYSFPSGHTMNGLVFYLALALVVWSLFGARPGRVAAIAATVLAILIGTSRIYLGAHYFSDVFGGFLAGLAWLLIVVAAFDAGSRVVTWRLRRSSASPAASSEAPARSGLPPPPA